LIVAKTAAASIRGYLLVEIKSLTIAINARGNAGRDKCRLIPMDPKVAALLAPNARILVARLDAVGDCILASSFFAGLRRLFPSAHLTGAFRPQTASLYDVCPLFDRIIRLLPGQAQSWPDLLQPPYDLAILPRWDVDHWSTRDVALLSGAPIRVGFERGPYRYDLPFDGWAAAYFTHLARTAPDRHEVAKGQDMLDFLGATETAPPPRLWIPADAEAEADAFLRERGLQHFAVLTVSAGWPNRIWPIENFLEVIDGLVEAAAFRDFVVIGAEDAAASGAWLERRRPGRVVSAAGTLPLLSSAALIGKAALYLGLDTGPMHMAAAAGVPVVEISCHSVSGAADHCNSPDRFGPYATPYRILRPAQPLPPCEDGCSLETESHCIRQVQPATVVAAALDLAAARS
jgi:ADP-heptose:LPS heptosyltransferase